MNNYTDNRKFWNTVKPLFSNYNGGSQNITLFDDDKIISNDEEVAQTLNKFFGNSVKSLNITENNALLNRTDDLTNPVDVALKMFENHPSIIDIKEKITVEVKFSFSKVAISDIKIEIRNLDIKKAGTFINISAKQLKQVEEVRVETLMQIWNKEIIENKKFPSELRCADISPIFKKLYCALKENYRPVSIISVVSKIFERIMQKQIKIFVEIHLSPFFCGYRKGCNTQYALTAMIEKWKEPLDKNGRIAGAIMMDSSKAFDSLNHELLIAKLKAYGFDKKCTGHLIKLPN